MKLSAQEFKTLTALESEASSDEELWRRISDCTEMLSEVGQVRDGERKALVEKTKALVETILAVAIVRRGLAWRLWKCTSPLRRVELKEKDSSPIFSVLLRRIIAPQAKPQALSHESHGRGEDLSSARMDSDSESGAE